MIEHYSKVIVDAFKLSLLVADLQVEVANAGNINACHRDDGRLAAYPFVQFVSGPSQLGLRNSVCNRDTSAILASAATRWNTHSALVDVRAMI